MSRRPTRSASALKQEAKILRWVYSRYLPRTPLDPSYGLELSDDIADDIERRFADSVHHKVLERLSDEIRCRQWIPREPELSWDLYDDRIAVIAAHIARARARPTGDPLILEELRGALDDTQRKLDGLRALMGGVGHNGAPIRDGKWQIVPESIASLASAIDETRQAVSSTSHQAANILASVQAVHAEAKRNGRLGDLVDMGIDEFVKGYGAQLGKNAAHATSALFVALLPLVFLALAYIASLFAIDEPPLTLPLESQAIAT